MTQIEENGLILAAFPSASYSTATQTLEASERMVLYTDGILETSNAAGDFFRECCVIYWQGLKTSPPRWRRKFPQFDYGLENRMTMRPFLICNYSPKHGRI